MSTIKANQWLNIDNTENFKCRAWVNFNGTGTVAIRASGNVSSITDNGTGDYTVNFINALPNANYSVVGATGSLATTGILRPQHSIIPTTTSNRLITINTGSTPVDLEYVNLAYFN